MEDGGGDEDSVAEDLAWKDFFGKVTKFTFNPWINLVTVRLR